MSHKVSIYTDGAASGNPGPGGYGVVLISRNIRKELSQGFKCTTNNRMELMAVIVALEALKKDNCTVRIYTDSKYVADAVEKGWVFEWEKKRFKKKKNADLWNRFLKSYRKNKVILFWIKGHAENKENIRCDKLAVEASQSSNLITDEGYEQENSLYISGFN
jgi:ribonuclease HI